MIETKVFCDRWVRRTLDDKECVGEIKRNDVFFDIDYGQQENNIQLCKNCLMIFLRNLLEDNDAQKIVNISRIRITLP